jgi:replicative DNA helicase
VLGSILLDESFFVQAAGTLEAGDFSLEKHRRIFKRMGDLQDRGEKIDRITVANVLMKFNELEACDGLSYLVSLDDGLPQIPNIDGYIHIVKDKAVLRRISSASQHMMNRCLLGEEEPGEILAGAEETLLKLGDERVKTGLLNPDGSTSGAFRLPGRAARQRRQHRVHEAGRPGGMHGGDLFIWRRGLPWEDGLCAEHCAARGPAHEATVAVFSPKCRRSRCSRMLCAAALVDNQRTGRATCRRRSAAS